MNETEPSIVTEQIDEQQRVADIQAKFDASEAEMQKIEWQIATVRAFLVKHREAISPFSWHFYTWADTEIRFNTQDYPKQDAKAIARAFGSDGWTRKMDNISCGSINWTKPLDGCVLLITHAEQITPKLKEEVRL